MFHLSSLTAAILFHHQSSPQSFTESCQGPCPRRNRERSPPPLLLTLYQGSRTTTAPWTYLTASHPPLSMTQVPSSCPKQPLQICSQGWAENSTG